jgi:hypothetical protein
VGLANDDAFAISVVDAPDAADFDKARSTDAIRPTMFGVADSAIDRI